MNGILKVFLNRTSVSSISVLLSHMESKKKMYGSNRVIFLILKRYNCLDLNPNTICTLPTRVKNIPLHFHF